MTAVLAALVLVAASLAVGTAISCHGRAWTWTAPAVGLSASMGVAILAVRLPGHGSTAAVALAVAVVVSAVYVVRRRVDVRPALSGLAAGALVLAFSLLPFLANRHMGELGASANDDLAFHLQAADVLRHGTMAHGNLGDHYPLGPHSLVAALVQGTGIGVETAFTGLLLAIPVLIGLTALAAFQGLSWGRRTLGATLVGVTYLMVSYVAQGAFKEPLMGLYLIGFTLVLRELQPGRRPSRRQTLALVAITAGTFADFGVLGLAWPAATLLWLAVLEYGPRASRLWRQARPRLGPALLVGAMAVVILFVLAGLASQFFDAGSGGRFFARRGTGGNFVGQLPPLEALGIWPAQDFRFPIERVWLEPTVAVAVAVALYGLLWCRRRREYALLAGALGGVCIYAAARPVTLAYNTGKALAIVSPLLVLIGTRALVDDAHGPVLARAGVRVVRAGALALFTLLACYSSVLALRSAHVRPQERGPDLAAFRPIVRGAPTLYLGRSNWLVWDLRGARAAGFQAYFLSTARRLLPRTGKSPGSGGVSTDMDSLAPTALDRFRYVIASRTAYASEIPPNFRAVAKTRWHVLFKRGGPTPGRAILNEGGAPGAILDCGRGAQRRLSRSRGVAFVRPRPVFRAARDWAGATGGPGRVTAGGSLGQTLSLPPGRWEVSLRYYSDLPLRVRVGPAVHRLPAYLDDSTTFIRAARVTSNGGPLQVVVEVAPRRRGDVIRNVTLGSLVATRVDDRGRTTPLARACGRYVDWYRLGPT